MPWTHHVCGWDWYRIKGTNGRECNCVCELGSPQTWAKETGKLSEKTDLQRQRAQPTSIPYSVPSLYTGACTCVYTHIIMYPFWHMAIYFPLSNERQAEGMAHILHNFKSQTFFCTCIKLEKSSWHLSTTSQALLHISGPSGTPGGNYIPCGNCSSFLQNYHLLTLDKNTQLTHRCGQKHLLLEDTHKK